MSFDAISVILAQFINFFMAQHNLLGNKGELLAARYLMEQGFAILEYNWRSGHKEIDLVAKERDVIVFVEVKTRSSNEYGDAQYAVTPAKMRNIIFAADAYIRTKQIDLQVRFDIVAITGDGDSHKIEHIRDAFYPEPR